jgi:phosphoribosylglycinamide formyltransferase 1
MNHTQPHLRDGETAHDARRLRVAVLASGGGSNLGALLERFNGSVDVAARVEVVVGSRAGIGALARAEAAGVLTEVIDPRTDQAVARLLQVLQRSGVGLVVLAGYMHLVPPTVVRAYAGRMINIHPALLPSFGGQGLYGARVHRAVLASGARVSGATVHLVDEEYDTGPILAQWPVPVLPDDTPDSLAARVLRLEHRLLPAVVEALAARGEPGPPPGDGAAFVAGDEGALTADAIRVLVRVPRDGVPTFSEPAY